MARPSQVRPRCTIPPDADLLEYFDLQLIRECIHAAEEWERNQSRDREDKREWMRRKRYEVKDYLRKVRKML